MVAWLLGKQRRGAKAANCGTPIEWNDSGRNVSIADMLHGHRQRVLYNLLVVALRLCAVWRLEQLDAYTLHNAWHDVPY